MQIMETNEKGGLYLPPNLLKSAKPHTRYIVEITDEQIVLRPESERPLWETASLDKRIAALRQWVQAHQEAHYLSDEALSRDSMYD
jgi:hypothetical protein